MSLALPCRARLEGPEINGDPQHERHETIPCYRSYREFVEKSVEDWPQYRWLLIFFSHRGGSSRDTRVTVFDSVDGSLIQTAFSITDPGRFRTFLDSRPSSVRSRIIILAYKETWSVDRKFVDILASCIGLDPEDLQRHLKHGCQRLESVPFNLDDVERKWERNDLISDSYYTPFLPSEQAGRSKPLQFDGSWGDRNTVLFAEGPQENSSSGISERSLVPIGGRS